MAGLWLAYARFLARLLQVPYEQALRLDLISYLPFVALLAYFLPIFQHTVNAATYLVLTTVALSLALKAAVVLAHFQDGLRALLARPYLVVGAIAGLGLVLRLSLIAANRFHGDEALYAHWGLLIAGGQDVWLRTEIVDKPPVFFYTLALFFKLFGPTETAARLPNIIASVADIAILYELARGLYGRRVAALAALFLALSSFDILFAPTAFTDPLMVALALAGCLAAFKGRFLAAGLLAGLALLTKPTALIFVPLLLFVVLESGRRDRPKSVTPPALQYYKRIGLLASGLGALIAVGALWDIGIRAGSPSVVTAGTAHYGGMTLVPLAELLPHLGEWLGQMRYLTASRPIDALLLVGVPLLVGYGLWRRERRPGWRYDLALAGFAVLFIAAHTVLSFQAWDRYLLGLVPVLALLLARVVLLPFDVRPWGSAAAWHTPVYAAIMAVFLAASLLWPAHMALRLGYPVGSDRGEFEGIDDVAAYFKGNVAPGAAVFHHWEGWHYSFYMFDYPYSFYYYPDAPYVLDLAQRLPPGQEKYVAFASWTDPSGLQATLQAGGWQLTPVYRTYRADGALSFTVYRIELQGSQPVGREMPQGGDRL